MTKDSEITSGFSRNSGADASEFVKNLFSCYWVHHEQIKKYSSLNGQILHNKVLNHSIEAADHMNTKHSFDLHFLNRMQCLGIIN